VVSDWNWTREAGGGRWGDNVVLSRVGGSQSWSAVLMVGVKGRDRSLWKYGLRIVCSDSRTST